MTILVFSVLLLIGSLPYILSIPIILIASGIGSFFQVIFIDYALILAMVAFVFSIRAIVFAWR